MRVRHFLGCIKRQGLCGPTYFRVANFSTCVPNPTREPERRGPKRPANNVADKAMRVFLETIPNAPTADIAARQ